MLVRGFVRFVHPVLRCFAHRHTLQSHNNHWHLLQISTLNYSWITLEQGKTTADAMGDVWRGLEVVEAATRVGSEMMVRF